MSALASYTIRGGLRNLSATTRVRSSRRTLSNLSPSRSWQHAPYTTTNRTIPVQSLHYFSSVSTKIDDDDDDNNIENKTDGGGGSGDDDADTNSSEVDALRAAIDRLKGLIDEESPTTANDDDGEEKSYTPTPVVDNPPEQQQRDQKMKIMDAAIPKLDLMDLMKSSPFDSSSSFEQTASHFLDVKKNTFDSSSSSATTNKKDTTKRSSPNLSDLLQTDIFSKSWSEPDTSVSSSRTTDGRHARGSGSDYKRPQYNDTVTTKSRSSPSSETSSWPSHSSSSPDSRRSFDNTTTAPTSSWKDYMPSETSEHQPPPPQQQQQPKITTPAEMEYNAILEQTDELLELLAKNDDSSTLQLMDFDKVMARWSRFHSQVDGMKNDGSTGVSTANGGGGYHGKDNNKSLKQQASEQCMKLLEALEHNYDCLLEQQSSSSRGEEKDISQKTTKHSQLMPNAASYNLALHALAHSEKGSHVAQEAYSILMRMLDRCQTYVDMIEQSSSEDGELAAADALPPPPFEPTIITVNSVVHAIAKSGARDAGHLAEEVFARMDLWRDQCAERKSRHNLIEEEAGSATLKKEGAVSHSPEYPTHFYRGVLPNARTLACVIDAWANAKTAQQQSFAPERAEATLELAIQRRRDYVDSVTGVVRAEVQDSFVEEEESQDEEDVMFINEDGGVCMYGVEEEAVDEELLLSEENAPMSLAQTTEEEALLQSSSIVTRMPYSVRPNTVSFNTCIHAWASSGRGREGALRADELLNQLEALSESEELDLPSGHFEEVIDSSDGSSDNVDSSSLKPNVRTYSMVMNAWANVAKLETRSSGTNAASRCEHILNKMEERGAMDGSIRPNLVAYVTSITAWARAAAANSHDDGECHAASKAEHILNRMIDLYYNEDTTELPSLSLLEGDVENASHDAPFNSVITAYARSAGDPYAAGRALAVLQRLEASPIAPTATSYNAAMDCCAKHGAPERALEVFDKMQEMSIAPDSTSYDTVLNAFARGEKEGSAERAWDFLCQLEEERSSGKSNFIPSSVSYSTVLNAFARASGNKDYGGIDTVKKAKEIYEKLIDQMKDGIIYGDADPFANSCFLNCCANVYGKSSEKKEALVTAITAFEEMKKRPDIIGEPNQYTFGTIMKACVRLSTDASEKNRLMESLFVQACKRGMLSRAVLGQFLRHTPSHFNMKVILSLGGSKREIPDSWHRNVPQKHWPTATANDGRY